MLLVSEHFTGIPPEETISRHGRWSRPGFAWHAYGLCTFHATSSDYMHTAAGHITLILATQKNDHP